MHIIAIVMAGAILSGSGEGPANAITQGEWANHLAEGTGLKAGLPPNASDEEVVRVLSQGGFIRKEGEDYVKANEATAVSTDAAFGAASQRKWILAKDKPAQVTYRVTIPLKRKYLLRARVRGGEQFWSVDGGKPVLIDPGKDFSWEKVGDDMVLAPGEHTVTVEIPPEGGLDVLEFITSSTAPIAPEGGYIASAPLAYADKAVSLVRALGWESFLPIDNPCEIWEAEAFAGAEGPIEVTDSTEHGKISQKRWIQPPSSSSSVVTYYLAVLHDGLYTFQGRFWGETENILSLEIDQNRVAFTPDNPDTFAWTTIATMPLAAGQHRMDIELKPGTGADVFQMLKRRADAEDYLILLAERGFLEGAFALSFRPEGEKRYAPWLAREAEKDMQAIGGYSLSRDTSHGSPSEGQWLQATGEKVKCRFVFDVSQPEWTKETGNTRSVWLRTEGEKSSRRENAVVSETADHGEPSAKQWLQATGEAVARFEISVPSENILPADRHGAPLLAGEAEQAREFGGAVISTAKDHGEPSSSGWVSATEKAVIRFETDLPEDTACVVWSRDFGGEPLLWKIDPEGDSFLLQRPAETGGKDSFAWHAVAPVFLPRGKHMVEVTLPQGSGFDAWEIRKGNGCAENLFTLFSRDFGGKPFTWTVDPDERYPIFRRRSPPPQENIFDWHRIAAVVLPEGKHILEVGMPSGSGLDVWEVRRKGWCDVNVFALYSRDFGIDPLVFRIDPEAKAPFLEQTIFPVDAGKFSWHEIATLSIPDGRHILEVAMTGSDGLDTWELRKRDSCACELEAIAGLPVDKESARTNIEGLKKSIVPPPPGPRFSPPPQNTPRYPFLSPFVPGDQ
ncbi:MAG: hypothetical protein NTV79_05275 [Candidatus Aureabacteria bacterium]|nr:hypothetical protein [Candidatus Auribacterota bacterium]